MASHPVQLLLNHGWHGAPPEATLICEADESAGHIIIPQRIVEAWPPTWFGLEPHGSYLSLLQRIRVDLDGEPVELLVAFRHGIYPRHGDSGGGPE